MLMKLWFFLKDAYLNKALTKNYTAEKNIITSYGNNKFQISILISQVLIPKTMKTIQQLERLRKIHQYIKICKTGSPNEFANKLGLSESQLYNVLDDLKINGFPISYSRKLKSYIYNEDCELEINYSVELLTSKEKLKIVGGFVRNCFTPMRLEWTNLF